MRLGFVSITMGLLSRITESRRDEKEFALFAVFLGKSGGREGAARTG